MNPDPLTSLLAAAGITILLVVLFAPRRGLITRWQQTRSVTNRILREDALKHIYQCELGRAAPSMQSLAGALEVSTNHIAGVLTDLEEHQLLEIQGTSFRLTSTGRDYALRVIRAHRLYERYLADQTGFQEAEWHDRAEMHEHLLTDDDTAALAMMLGHPTHDPHGDPIPTAEGELVIETGQPLSSLPADTLARITHIEDEPEAVYAQLVAEGLHPGMEVQVLESSPSRVRFWAGGDEHLLAPLLAANITATLLPDPQAQPAPIGDPLYTLHPGESGRVLGISPRSRGAERRRMMDLGILPGTVITAEMSSPSGDPTAYRIRGAVIALRKTQAETIRIKKMNEEIL